MLRHVTLRYVTLRYITLQTLPYVTSMLHYITLRYSTLHYITLHYVTYMCVRAKTNRTAEERGRHVGGNAKDDMHVYNYMLHAYMDTPTTPASGAMTPR